MFLHMLSCIYILMSCLFFVWILLSQILGAKFINLFLSFVDLFEFASNPFHLLFCAGLLYILSSRGFHPQEPTCLRSLESFEFHQLWPVAEMKETNMPLTIIFFHGLQSLDRMKSWKTTWTQRGTDVCWPQEWLPEALGMEIVRTISVSYDSIASNWGKGEEVPEVETLGSNLVDKLIHEGGEWWLHKDNKIVLVGHSFGGIVIKSLTVEASKHASSSCEMCKTFLKYIKGIIFYAVPHSGRLIAQYVENFDKAFHHRLAGVVRGLKEFEVHTEQLSNNFHENILELSSDQAHAPHGIKLFSFAERLKYNEVLVVPLASVTKLAGHSMIVNANHVDICKPATKGDPGYEKLLEILETILVPDSNYHMSTSTMKQSARSTPAETSCSESDAASVGQHQTSCGNESP
ncbi:unnamed protein product [Sphagnum balticum]